MEFLVHRCRPGSGMIHHQRMGDCGRHFFLLRLCTVICVVVFFFGISTFIEAQSGDTISYTLLDYCRVSLEQSEEIASAMDTIEQKEEAYRNAVSQGAAIFSIKSAETELEAAKRRLQEIEANDPVNAAQRFFTLLQRQKELSAARTQREIEEERLRIRRLRHEQGLITENDLLSQISTNLSARSSVLEAEIAYNRAKWEFYTAVDIGMNTKVDLIEEKNIYQDNGAPADFSVEQLLQQAKQTGSTYFTNSENVALAREKMEAMKNPEIGTVKERAQAEQDYVKAERTYNNYYMQLVNEVNELVNQYIIAVENLDLIKNQLVITEKQYEVTQIQYENGDVFLTDVQQKTLDIQKSRNRLKQSKESLFINQLKIAAKVGGDVLHEIEKKAVSSD